MSETSADLPVIIIGAGLAGLTFAQALRKANIPFEIYERDVNIEASAGGWGITVHWVLPQFKECLPDEIFERLESVQVDPEQGRNDTGKFCFLDLSTAKAKYEIPPTKRLRLNRRMLRKLLAEDIDVKWNKTTIDFKVSSEDQKAVKVRFGDGSETRGNLLVGVDGTSSRIRRQLMGESEGKAIPLGVRAMGVTTRLTENEINPLLEIDPLLFQGCHPETGVFLWYSTLSTPESNGSLGAGAYYEAQILLSWIHESADDDIPQSKVERLNKMKSVAQNFEARLRSAIQNLPEGIEVLEVKLQDWSPRAWDNCNGLVTLLGDAAHAMTMYRGQAFNHGIADAAVLSKNLSSANAGSFESQKAAVDNYEQEMRSRTYDAVLLSRQATFDAHDFHKLTADSPLVSARAQVLKKAS